MAERETWVEAELLKFLVEHDRLSSYGDVWVSGMLPEGQFCSILQEDGSHDVFLASAVTRFGVVGLAAQRVCSSFVRVQPDLKRLSFHFAFDLKKVHVLPTKAASPLKVFLKDSAPLHKLSCMVELTGAPLKLLDWQTENGFIGLAEEQLNALTARLDPPAELLAVFDGDGDADPKMCMALGCMRTIDPGLTEADAICRLRHAYCHDPANESAKYIDECFDDEVLEDLLEKSDRKEIRDARQGESKVVKDFWYRWGAAIRCYWRLAGFGGGGGWEISPDQNFGLDQGAQILTTESC